MSRKTVRSFSEPRAELSPGEWDVIMTHLRPLSPLWETAISAELQCVLVLYLAGAKFEKFREPDKLHRKRLESIYRLSFQLKANLRNEFGAGHLVCGVDDFKNGTQDEVNNSLNGFYAAIDNVITTSKAALWDPDLRAKMQQVNSAHQLRKSQLRRDLWEPLFDIWTQCKGNIGFSVDGPVHRFIDAVQLA
jgi:hypothetical protein